MSVHLGDLYLRNGWTLKRIFDQQGGSKVGPLPVKHLMSRILWSYHSHGILINMDIKNEMIFSGEGTIHHKSCRCGWEDNTRKINIVPENDIM